MPFTKYTEGILERQVNPLFRVYRPRQILHSFRNCDLLELISLIYLCGQHAPLVCGVIVKVDSSSTKQTLAHI